MESSELRDMDFSEVPTVRLLLANTLADGTLELQATMIPLSIQSPEASIRTISLQLANASGITMLPNNEIFEGMGQMGNMKRGFRGAPRPLLPAMLLVATSNLNVEQSPPPIPTHIPAFTPTPIPETDPDPMEHTFEEPSPVHQHFSPPQEHAQGQMTLDDLLQVVPQLMTKIDSLEKDLKQTKLTMGSAIVKLVKKVKKMEDILKRRNVVLSDSEEEEYEAQRRKSQDNPLVSLVQGLVTPSKTTVQTSGEIREGRVVKETDVKTASTPMETQKALLKVEDGEEVDVHLYRSMISSLMYLTSSRPDIMFGVCACARYQVNLKVSHLHAVKIIFRYLKGQPKLGLWYLKDSPFDLVAYTDSDYAGASLDRKSTKGGCQFLRCRLISWQCKKQTVVANSTTEVEYVAASSCCGQVLWIQNQLLDNESTICIVKNPIFHSKTKHIEITHHFIRDSNEKKLI
ncbi:hypothetical protein Tco_1201523 [Tanacetum coccineum]